MTKKLFQSQAGKVKTGFWSLNPNNLAKFFFYLLLLFLPTQFGKHFWPQFSFVYGLRLDYLSPTIYLTDILIFFIFIFYLKELCGLILGTSKKKLLIFGAFLLVVTIGIIQSINPLAGWYGFIKLLEFTFLVFFIFKNLKTLNKKYIFYCLSLGVVFETILSILQYFNQGSMGGLFYYFGERTFNPQTPGIANASINGQLFLRPYGTFSHPNVLAGYLIITTLLIFLFSLRTRFIKLFLTLVILLSSMTLILTLSRVAIVLWFACLLILFGLTLLEKYKKRILNINLFFLFLIAVGIFSFLFANFQTSPIVQRFTSTKLSDESVIQREQLINQSVLMFQKSPLFGVGLNNFFNNLNIPNSQLAPLLIQPVHNIFLLTLSETGVLGFGFFTLLLYECFSILNKKLNGESSILILALSSVLLLGMFDHYFLTLQQGQIMLSLILGTSLAYKNT